MNAIYSYEMVAGVTKVKEDAGEKAESFRGHERDSSQLSLSPRMNRKRGARPCKVILMTLREAQNIETISADEMRSKQELV